MVGTCCECSRRLSSRALFLQALEGHLFRGFTLTCQPHDFRPALYEAVVRARPRGPFSSLGQDKWPLAEFAGGFGLRTELRGHPARSLLAVSFEDPDQSGENVTTTRRPIQALTSSTASFRDSGRRNRFFMVLTRKKARTTECVRPTASLPFKHSAHNGLACSKNALLESWA